MSGSGVVLASVQEPSEAARARKVALPVSKSGTKGHERSESHIDDVQKKREESAKRSFRSRRFLGGSSSSASRDSRDSRSNSVQK